MSAEPLRCLPAESLVTGWDFSTGSVKCLAFNLQGETIAEVRLPTDLWTEGGVSELNLMQLEGQAAASVRAMAVLLREHGRLGDWRVGGISATHHSAGRIDRFGNQVRRAICWNDQTLAEYHARGLERLGGPKVVNALIGGPWAVRYSLSHLVKDEAVLSREDWLRTTYMLPHGPLAAGYLTGRFDATSVSSAASTGIMDLRSEQWSRDMLGCLAAADLRELAWKSLPKIISADEPIGPLSEAHAVAVGIPIPHRPLIFPTLDDQAAGLVGGGAVDPGQIAIILGNSAVVNSSAGSPPQSGNLDAMKLNWGPYLWMRCYSNGAQFLDRILGHKPDFDALEAAARNVPPGCGGVGILPFALSEPSLGVSTPRLRWYPHEPKEPGIRFRASLEALAYLIALGVREHVAAGQAVTRVTVSGGIARSQLMGEILASAIGHSLERLVSNEGPALGGAVTALAGAETYWRKRRNITDPFHVADAVAHMVKFRDPIKPNPNWNEAYRKGLTQFEVEMKK